MLIRIITDGKAGDLVQCLGVAEQVIALAGGSIEERMVRPRFLYSLAMPWGPADPRDAAAAAEPYPDIAIASGRRAVASIRLLKRRAPGCFTVFLKDPRTGPSSADLIWVPAHDRLRGPNVVTSMTSPHRITTEKLNAASACVRADILRVAKPRVAVLVGGASRDVAFERSDRQRLLSDLIQLARSGAGLMVTPSRRTPAEFVAQLQEALVPLGAWIWDGQGDNPYLELLALADQVVVTADSANMVSEAAATGRPILVFEPVGLPAKLRRFLGMLVAHGAVAKFHGRLENLDYDPLDSTPLIAREILERYHRGPSR